MADTQITGTTVTYPAGQNHVKPGQQAAVDIDAVAGTTQESENWTGEVEDGQGNTAGVVIELVKEVSAGPLTYRMVPPAGPHGTMTQDGADPSKFVFTP